MLVNIHVIATIRSNRSFTIVEVANLVKAYLGIELVLDVPDTTTIQELENLAIAQVGIVDLPVMRPTTITWNGVELEDSATLAQLEIPNNTTMHLQVTVHLT